MLNVFAPESAVDISEGHENVSRTTCAFLKGSPRDLLVTSDIKTLASGIREIKDCALEYKIYYHKKLLKIHRLVSENEPLGRFDIIPGLVKKPTITDNDTHAKNVPCLGDEELTDKKRGLILVPATPSVCIPMTLKLADLQLIIPKRSDLERRMIESTMRGPGDASNAQILSRTLKVGLHNGHTVMSGEWRSFKLQEDDKDKELLFTAEEIVEIGGYVPSEFVGLVFLINYEIGLPSQSSTHYNSQAMMNSTMRRGKAVTFVNLGAALFVPSNGRAIFLRNRSKKEGDFGVELPLRYDDLCAVLTRLPNYGSKDRALLERHKDLNADGDDTHYGVVLAFDLTAVDAVRGPLDHEDDVTAHAGAAGDDLDAEDAPPARSASKTRESKEEEEEELPPSRRRSAPEAKKESSPASGRHKYYLRPSSSRPKDDDEVSVADSIVGGNSEHSSFRIDPTYYHMRVPADDVVSVTSEISDTPLRVPENKNSLLAQSLQAKLVGKNASKSRAPAQAGRGHRADIMDDHDAQPKVQPASSYSRELSRGVKTRLDRHGFGGVIEDRERFGSKEADERPEGDLRHRAQMVDVRMEAADKLSVNDVTIQFAGYRAGKLDDSGAAGSMAYPRSVYFSFQFYTCMPTRTEPMRLLPADKGQACVLARDEAHVREEAPLALRYVIDCSSSSPIESTEFAEYLAHSTLYVDAWDADSLLLLGTIGVPLRRIMRQGSSHAKAALECDVVNAEMSVQSHGGIQSSVVANGGPMSGTVVGSVHLIIANHGLPGKRLESKATSTPGDVDGLNWRALGAGGIGVASKSASRARMSVRAKPLSESTPALSEALRNFKPSGGVSRSLTSMRGAEGAHTLTYDEVVVLFKRFQGAVKGTVQYNGALLSLLDVPSWNVTLKKLLKAYFIVNDDAAMVKELLRYSDARDAIDFKNLTEFFKDLFDKFGIAHKPAELAILANKFCPNGKGTAVPADLVAFLRAENDRQLWMVSSRRVRLAGQKASLVGADIEQMLADRDKADRHAISTTEFSDFLRELGKYGKISQKDMRVTMKHFGSKENPDLISLNEVMAFFGKQYVGNLIARFAKAVTKAKGTELSRAPEDIVAILAKHNKSDSTTMSYDDLESGLAALGVYGDLSREQVRSVLTKIDSKGTGKVSMNQLLTFVGLSTVAGDLTPEYLLNLLLERVRGTGLAIDEAFRYLDTDGNGSLSRQEFQVGMEKLGIFDNIKDWKKQIPGIVKNFDVNNDNTISLSEFFKYMGITDYTPNILQRMTKIFSVALQQGLSLKDIFEEFDADGGGSMSAGELVSGLKKLGTFGEVSDKDIATIVEQFDRDGDNSISKSEFTEFFSERVAKATLERKRKKVEKISVKFRNIIVSVQKQNVSIEQLFAVFDTDKGGSISASELGPGLRKMPPFKSITDEEITDLCDVLDTKKNGEISLSDFKAFVNAADAADSADPSRAVDTDCVKRVQDVFRGLEARGFTAMKIFENIDVDRSGRVTLSEVEATLRRLKEFDSLSKGDLGKIISYMDSDGDGSVSMDELVGFLRTGYKPIAAAALESRDKESRDKATPKQVLIQQMKRLSSSDGGLSSMLAHMDSDEDGLIPLSLLMGRFRKEGLFEVVPEDSAAALLRPMTSKGLINIGQLVKFVETMGEPPASAEDDEDNERDEFEGIPLVEYDFSRDPETRALEKKMRSLGRVLAKKGVDVEGIFKSFDLREAGTVRRTEFLEVMSKMGLYILEQGKVIDGAENEENDVRRLQMSQMRKLKGAGDGAYLQNASRAARKLVMSGGAADTGDFKEHLESMALINWYRQGQKKMLLQRLLSHSLATSISIFPRFGKTLFFEQPITNPFAHEERFIIDLGDPEIRLVTGLDEWLHLRQACAPCHGSLGPDPVEAEMFDRDGHGNIQVVLLPGETLFLPFTFMTLVPFVRRPDGLKKRRAEESKYGEGESKGADADEVEDPSRCIDVRVISGTHGHIVSLLKFNVFPRAFVVNRTLRFFEPENTTMRRRIQLVGGLRSSSYPGEYNISSKYIHCVEGADLNADNGSSGESKVVVEWGPSSGNSAGALDLFLRYKCGAFPSVGSFHVLLYDDPYQSRLHETWHVVVQSRQRLDVHSNVGSTAAVDLVVRGDRYARRVRAFASPSPDAFAFSPQQVFQLVPGAYNRVAVGYTPKAIGSTRVQINLVDVDSRELLNAWLLSTTASAPAVARAYDVDVVRGRASHKKIIFKNPWDVPKRFVLSSSDEGIMRARAPTLDVAAQGTSYLRLWFSGATLGRETSEVYLFLNDDHGQNEEAFLFRIHFMRDD